MGVDKMNDEMPSRRSADLYTRETTETVRRLSDRVLVLETDMRNTNSRLSGIESRIDELQNGIERFMSIFYEYRDETHKRSARILAWVIATLLSVVFSCATVIYELLR